MISSYFQSKHESCNAIKQGVFKNNVFQGKITKNIIDIRRRRGSDEEGSETKEDLGK